MESELTASEENKNSKNSMLKDCRPETLARNEMKRKQ